MSSPVAKRTGRRAKVGAAATPTVCAVRPGLQGGLYKPLSHKDMLRIHETVLKLLEELGLSQITPSLEKRALAAGCHVTEEGRLLFPRNLVEDILAKTRKSFVLHGLDPARDIEVGKQRVHTGTGGAAPTIVDFETGLYRESTVSDLYDIARLVDKLDHIHWYHRSIIARDAKTVLDLDINTTYACLQGTSKPIAVSYTTGESARLCAVTSCRPCALPQSPAIPWNMRS